ncbi:MAG: tetratricopeptide repeat protein [bacterium]
MHIVKSDKKNNQIINRVKGLWFKADRELQLGKWLKAVQYLNRCIEIKKDYIPAFQSLADIYFQQGNLVEAEDYIKEALEYAPNDPRNHFIMGRIFINRDIHVALHHFEKAKEFGDLTWGVAHNLAFCYIQLNLYEKAWEFLQKAQELEPGNIKTCLLAAEFYRVQNKLNDAKEKLLEAKRVRPHDLSIDYLLGFICLNMDKYKECLLYWERFYRANSNDINFVKKLIEVYYHVGQIDRCIQILRETLELDPNNNEIKMTLDALQKLSNKEEINPSLERSE